MFEKYAHWVHKFRFLIIIAWIVLTAAAYFALPQLKNVVSHESSQYLANNSTVVVAQNLLKQVNPKQSAQSSAIVAIHNDHGLSKADKQYFKEKLALLDKQPKQYGIKFVQDNYNTSASLASKFNSSDHTVEIASVGFPGNDTDQKTVNALANIKRVFTNPPRDANVLFTGDVPLEQDQTNTSLDGASKTAGVTVVLVLVILLLVFRSAITPFVTLLSIGISFLFSSSLVGWLASLGLPASTFTQTFLIAIIFGAGTDYSIIILNRFREELGHGLAPIEALAAGLRGVAKTVIFSALTVLVSFAILYFAHFSIYRSAVGVAVGVFVTIFTCLTFIPALIMALGRFIFWPRKIGSTQAHKPSRMWNATGRVALRHPWWTLLCAVIVLLPIGLMFTDKRSFDPLSDIPSAASVKGFNTVAGAFGQGNVMPSDVVISSPDNLRSQKGLATIENVSNAIAQMNGVKEVDSATRPTGTVLKSFQIASQNKEAAGGLKQVQSGLNLLSGKLVGKSTSTSLQPLVSGAKGVQQGAGQLHSGLQQVTSQTNQLTTGAKQLQQGAQSIKNSETQLATGATSTASGAGQLASGASQAAKAATQLATGASSLSDAAQTNASNATKLADLLAQWEKAHPDASSTDPTWQQIVQLANATEQGTSQAETATKQLSANTKSLSSSLSQLSSVATQVKNGANQLAAGQQKLAGASGQLVSGLAQFTQGSSQLHNGLFQLTDGAAQLASGSTQLASGVSELSRNLGQLSSGVNQAGNAVDQLSSGVGQVKTALQQSATATTTGNPGFYVPASAVHNNADLKQAMDAYISKDGHVADIKVVLSTDPYSMTAIKEMPTIQQHAEIALAQSPLAQGQILMTGTTPTQTQLNSVSNADFVRTIILILIAIFILLMIFLRSIIAPLYIIFSLAGTYFITMGILQFVAVHLMGKPGISWSVPFFAFLLLVALGVDYSIFLMSRFDEELAADQHASVRAAMHRAMRNMGNVIFSAALIMGGTFGSMVVAGVTTLVEIGLSILIGLAIYFFIMLAFFVPACVAVVENGHFWPFRRAKTDDAMESAISEH